MNTVLYFEKSKKVNGAYTHIFPTNEWNMDKSKLDYEGLDLFNINTAVRPYITLDGEGWDLLDENLELWDGEYTNGAYGAESSSKSYATKTDEYYDFPTYESESLVYVDIPIRDDYYNSLKGRILSIIFKDYSVRSVKIVFKNVDTIHETINEYLLTDRILTIDLPEYDFEYVRVSFLTSFYPQTSVKIDKIYYGRVIEFTDFMTLTENNTEYQYCNDLAIGTLSSEVVYGGEINETDRDRAFLYVGSKLKNRYTVKSIKKASEVTYQLECEDIIGELGGNIYDGKVCPTYVASSTTPAQKDVTYDDIVSELSIAMDLTLVLDDTYKGKIAYGFIKPDTCRFALVQIMFSLQARFRYDAENNIGYIEPNRSDYLRLYNTDDVDVILGDATVSENVGQSVELNFSQYISPLSGNTFTTSIETVYKGANSAGTKILFDIPHLGYQCTPVPDGKWGIDFTLTSINIINTEDNPLKQITVSSYPYKKIESKINIGTGDSQSFTSSFLDYDNANTLAKEIYALSKYGNEVTASIIGDIEVGQRVDIDTAYSGRYQGIVTKTTKDYCGENIISDITISNARQVQ